MDLSSCEDSGGAVPEGGGGSGRPVSLKRNFSWTFVGNFVYAGAQWLMLALIAKIGDPIMVGVFALAQAVTSPPIIFTNLQLREVQATDARRQYEFGHYFAIRLVSSCLAFLIIAAVAMGAGSSRAHLKTILVMAVARIIESLADIIYGYFQQSEALDRISISLILKGFLSLLGLGLGLCLTRSIFWGTVGMTLAWAAVLLGYDLPTLHRAMKARGRLEMAPRWEIGTLFRLVRTAFPLGLATLLVSLNLNYPRLVLERELGAHALGIFAAMAALTIAGKRVTDALDQAVIPRLAMLFSRGDREGVRKLLLRLILIGFILGLGGVLISWIWGPRIMTILYTREYSTQNRTLILLMVGGGIGYVVNFLATAVSAMRQFKKQLYIQAVNYLFILLATTFFIRRWHLEGVAWLTIVSVFLQLCIYLVDLRRVLTPLRPNLT